MRVWSFTDCILITFNIIHDDHVILKHPNTDLAVSSYEEL